METFAETESRKRERSQFEEEDETEIAQKKPDLRNEISESKSESANIEKPLDEWTADEVQQWFQKNDFSKYYPKFEGLSGKLLSKLSENNFISLLKDNDAIAMALYNTIQELKEPKERLPRLSTIRDPKEMYRFVVNTMLADIDVPKPPPLKPMKYQKLLGRFHKVDLPFSGKEVDPRLLDDCLTSVGKEMVESLKSAEMHYILLGKSGEGKTRAIFDVARNVFTIVFECVTPGDERQEVTKDRAFLDMAKQLYTTIDWSNVEEARQRVEYRVDVEIVSRLLLLRLLTIKFPQLTPQEFLLSQLNGGSEVISKIVRVLLNESWSDIISIRIDVMSDLQRDVLIGECKNLVFAVDEAGLAQQFLFDRFKSPKSKDPRGLLTVMVRCLMPIHASTIYAATNRSLGMGETLQSDIGKPDTTILLSNFEVTDRTMNKKRLKNCWI